MTKPGSWVRFVLARSAMCAKDAEPETLLAAVRAVARGKTYIDPCATTIGTTAAAGGLTPRETDVLRHLALGQANRDIAAALGIGDETVKRTSPACSRSSASRIARRPPVEALRRGLVSLDELDSL